jgi:hypothetical protein
MHFGRHVNILRQTTQFKVAFQPQVLYDLSVDKLRRQP